MDAREREREEARRKRSRDQNLTYSAGGAGAKPKKRDVAKVGRNDPCPCGSGKKIQKVSRKVIDMVRDLKIEEALTFERRVVGTTQERRTARRDRHYDEMTRNIR